MIRGGEYLHCHAGSQFTRKPQVFASKLSYPVSSAGCSQHHAKKELDASFRWHDKINKDICCDETLGA